MMRLGLTLRTTRKGLPFSYQHELIRSFHRHLPDNSIHDDISLYSLSWLRGGEKRGEGLYFAKGAFWDISFFEDELAKQFLIGILKDKDIAFGMSVGDVKIIDPPEFGSKTRFLLQSPVLLKTFSDAKSRHILYTDSDADEVMTNAMKSKLSKAGMDTNILLSFDREYTHAKTKLVDIKGVKNKTSYCPVVAEGNPEVLAFVWSVGLGHSTGSGFGSVF